MSRFLLNACFRLAALCSRRWSVRIARGVAWLLVVVRSETAHVTRTNLRTCLPHLDPVEQREVLRESLVHMTLLFFELAQLRYWDFDPLLASVRVTGKDVLDRAFADHRGVLLLVPHFGNWEIMCAYLGHHYSFAALYDRPKVSALEDFILAARQGYQGKLFPIDTGGMRSVFRELRDGRLVAILPDQVPDRNAGVYVPFFGEPALTMTLPHRLIERAQPTVLLGSVYRKTAGGDELDGKMRGAYTYELRFEALFADGVEDLTPETSSARINAAIEETVRVAPAQYQWEYKRFKRPPQGGYYNIYRRQ